MFSVISKKKASRWFIDTSKSWQDSIKTEDTMTALLFDSLIGVSGITLSAIFSKLIFHTAACDFEWLTKDNFYDFPWLKLQYNGSIVEPDRIFIDNHSKNILVVEVKRDCCYQTIAQLSKEVEAVLYNYSDFDITLMVLGGENHYQICNINKFDTKFSICSSSWMQFLNAIKKVNNDTDDPRDNRILNYILESFEWFGYTAFDGFNVNIPCNFQPYIGFFTYPVVDKESKSFEVDGHLNPVGFNFLEQDSKLNNLLIEFWRLV